MVTAEAAEPAEPVEPEELAVMVRLGRLRMHVEDDGAFDSAMQGVIERLDASGPAPAVTLH